MSNNQIAIAEAIARLAHFGQYDKIGDPYIEHARRVAAAVKPAKVQWDDFIYVSTAWLHDVIEDTAVVTDQLNAAGVVPDVIKAVGLLTKIPGEPNVDYYNRLKSNPYARAVKIADMKDNLDPKRLAKLDDDTIARLVKKYAKGLEILGG